MSAERVAVVVGAASGIGWASARALAADGCRVIVADRNTAGAERRAAELGAPHRPATVEVKAGLAMRTQVAALEMAPRGIRVNAVSPGFVHTPLTEPAAAIPGVVEEYLENTPLGRVGTPEDVADAVVFLCSPKASWLTGEVLDLNGGAHLKRYPDVLGHVMKLAAP
jgi:NAD(P)-dependent dehydrogenase (short-subunit alcohol dehydrogenase family)